MNDYVQNMHYSGLVTQGNSIRLPSPVNISWISNTSKSLYLENRIESEREHQDDFTEKVGCELAGIWKDFKKKKDISSAKKKCNKAERNKQAAELCVQYPTTYLNTHVYLYI